MIELCVLIVSVEHFKTVDNVEGEVNITFQGPPPKKKKNHTHTHTQLFMDGVQ